MQIKNVGGSSFWFLNRKALFYTLLKFLDCLERHRYNTVYFCAI